MTGPDRKIPVCDIVKKKARLSQIDGHKQDAKDVYDESLLLNTQENNVDTECRGKWSS